MRKLAVVAICVTFIGGLALVPTQRVYSQEFGYDLSGIIYEQPIYQSVDHKNLINPDDEVLRLPHWLNKSWGKINLNLSYGDFKFVTQTRPILTVQEKHEPNFDFITDDAYLDVGIAKRNFLYAGKRNLVEGVAYGANPTDFLGENKKLDYTLRAEERRTQRPGNYVVGGDVLLKDVTLSAVYAPKLQDWQQQKERILLKGKLLLESINTDMTLHLFWGDIPAVGFDMSSTVSDNLILYTESALRWGSEKLRITQTSEGSNIAAATYSVSHPKDRNKLYPNIVVGGSYTFGDGTNIIGEYIYNGSGYSRREWTTFGDFVKYNNKVFKYNLFPESGMQNLVRASEIFIPQKMRKNYAFFRISNSKLIENVDGQLVMMVNADDGSGLGYLSVDYKVTKNFIAGIYSTVYLGKKDSEFGMQYWPAEFGFLFRYYFTVPNYLKKTEKKSG